MAVAVWSDSQTPDQYGAPTAPWNLYFQTYASSGGATPTLSAAAGGQLQSKNGTPVSSNSGGGPIVAMAPTSGNFAIAWGASSSNSSGNTSSAYVQLYSKAGKPLTDPIQIGSAGDASLQSIAMDETGFDVAYMTIDQRYVGNTYLDIYVQRYSTTGAAVGSPIKVYADNAIDKSMGISMDGKGNFVVGWGDATQVGNVHSSTYTYNLHWQRYTSAGKPAESAKQEATGHFPTKVNLVMDANEDFAFTWNEGSGLQAQTVYANDSLGSKNLIDASASTPASMAMQPATGNYALSWADSNYGGFTNFYSSVNADTFLLSGQPQQPSFQVYETTTYPIQQSTAAAADSNGNLLVIYAGYGTYSSNGMTTVYTDGGIFGDFYVTVHDGHS